MHDDFACWEYTFHNACAGCDWRKPAICMFSKSSQTTFYAVQITWADDSWHKCCDSDENAPWKHWNERTKTRHFVFLAERTVSNCSSSEAIFTYNFLTSKSVRRVLPAPCIGEISRFSRSSSRSPHVALAQLLWIPGASVEDTRGSSASADVHSRCNVASNYVLSWSFELLWTRFGIKGCWEQGFIRMSLHLNSKLLYFTVPQENPPLFVSRDQETP